MGATRAWAPHTRWTVSEENIVRTHYPTASLDSLELAKERRAMSDAERASAAKAKAEFEAKKGGLL